MNTAVFVLAAGSGTRFASGADDPHKLLALFRGRPLLSWSVDAARAAEVGPVTVIAGATDLTGVLDEVEVVHNPDWADGQATSLAVAVAVARRLGVDAFVVGLGDQPLVTAEGWRRVAASRSPIAVATYRGKRRTPVRFAREVWPLLPTTGDHGARHLIASREDLVEPIPCPGDPLDIDTQEDLARWT